MTEASHKYLRISCALYLAIYLCLIIPWHQSAHAHLHIPYDTAGVQGAPDGDAHDPHHCQICLTSGQVAFQAGQNFFDPLIDVNVEPEVGTRTALNGTVIVHGPSRAPPVAA